MKDTFYFSHDYSTRADPKIKKLIQKHGMLGYGIFWTLVEDLYQNANQLPADYENIAYDLRVDARLVESVVTDFGLFRLSQGLFSSDSIARRMQHRMDKIEKAKKSAEARWNKHKKDSGTQPPDANAPQADATAMHGIYNSNAIKETIENTGKDTKANESIEKHTKENAATETIADRGGNFQGKFSGARTGIEKNNNSSGNRQAPKPGAPDATHTFGDGVLQQQCRRFAADNEQKYPLKMYVDFLLYWTAIVQNGKKSEIGKEKWRIQETFQIASRLSTWFSKNPNQYQNNGATQSNGLNTLKHLGATAIFPDDKDYSGRT